MDEAQVLAVAALADPTRRRADETITQAVEPVGRDVAMPQAGPAEADLLDSSR